MQDAQPVKEQDHDRTYAQMILQPFHQLEALDVEVKLLGPRFQLTWSGQVETG